MSIPISSRDETMFSTQTGLSETDSILHLEQSEYLSEIVAAATLAPPGREIQTFKKCRRRPERKPCPGQIMVLLQENPAQLLWWCSECGDKGVIRNWKGIPGFVVHTKKDPYSNQISCKVVLSEDEYALLCEIVIIEPLADKAVKGAYKVDDGYLLSDIISTFDTIMGYIAFEANHSTKKSKRNALNKLLNRLNEHIDNLIQS